MKSKALLQMKSYGEKSNIKANVIYIIRKRRHLKQLSTKHSSEDYIALS